MPIRPSAGAEVRQLIEALGATDEVTRESAIARLAVIGPRALEHLLNDFPSAAARARAGMLRVFESTDDARVLPLARASLADASALVQSAAMGVLRTFSGSRQPQIAREALDTLVAVALDSQRVSELRLAAMEALKEQPDVWNPIKAKLATDADPAVSGGTATSPPGAAESGWADAVAGRLPATPAALKQLLASSRPTARLTELQHLVDHIRAQEQRETDALVREEWRALRGAAHQALAARNSRLALYDLRDSLLGADRLPVAFLAALEEIGDASCLEPLAAAYDASSRSSDAWWREHVALAFRAIFHREGLTRRHAAVKRTMSRWPDAAAELMARL
jgi:hypothetical protein